MRSREKVVRWEISSVVTGSKEESVECGDRDGMLFGGDIETVTISLQIAAFLFCK